MIVLGTFAIVALFGGNYETHELITKYENMEQCEAMAPKVLGLIGKQMLSQYGRQTQSVQYRCHEGYEVREDGALKPKDVIFYMEVNKSET